MCFLNDIAKFGPPPTVPTRNTRSVAERHNTVAAMQDLRQGGVSPVRSEGIDTGG